jgi:hypothetical protein
MFKSKFINASETFYIRSSIIIDLDILKIIHTKVLESGYNKAEYLFSLYMTDYNCKDLQELDSKFEENKISEINCLKVIYRNENFDSITIDFQKEDLFFDSHCVSIRTSESRGATNNLLKELVAILNFQNQYRYKRFANVIMNPNLQIVVYSILFTLSFQAFGFINSLPDEAKHYFRGIIYPFMGLLAFILKFSSTQKVRIIKRNSQINTFWKDILQPSIIGIVTGIIVLVLNHYWFKL